MRVVGFIADWVNENRRLCARVQELIERNNREVERGRLLEEDLRVASLVCRYVLRELFERE